MVWNRPQSPSRLTALCSISGLVVSSMKTVEGKRTSTLREREVTTSTSTNSSVGRGKVEQRRSRVGTSGSSGVPFSGVSSLGVGEGGGEYVTGKSVGDGSPQQLRDAAGQTVDMRALLDCFEAKMAHLDVHARAFELLRRGKPHVCNQDFLPVLNDLVARHPGLEFLSETPEFQERYAETVIHRIFYGVNRSDTGKMTLRELGKSDLLEAMAMADDEEDINRVVKYFSYEHFYGACVRRVPALRRDPPCARARARAAPCRRRARPCRRAARVSADPLAVVPAAQ